MKLTIQRVHEVGGTRAYKPGERRPEISLQPTLELKATSPNKGSSSSFIMIFDLELDDKKEEFNIVIPQYLIDGNAIPSRTIHFVERRDVWIQPFNC